MISWQEIIESHHGTIAVESKIEEGTTFIIKFPFNSTEWVSNAEIPNPSTQLLSKNSLWTELQEEESRGHLSELDSKLDGPIVLIIEDHKEVRAYLKTLLSSEFRIITAGNGKDALEVLKVHNVEIILTDLMMPVMDGFEFLEKIKK